MNGRMYNQGHYMQVNSYGYKGKCVDGKHHGKGVEMKIADQLKSQPEVVEEIMKRVAANDDVTIRMLARHYYKGENSFPQDQTKAMVLVVVWSIMTWVEFMREKEIIRRPSSTLVMAGYKGSRTALGKLEFLLAKYEQPE